MSELKKVTFYDGYKADDLTIQFFWEVKGIKIYIKRSPRKKLEIS